MIAKKNSLSPHNDNYETNYKYIKCQHLKILQLALPKAILTFQYCLL